MSEGSRHFEEHSAVFQTLHKIAERLESLGISYAIVGGMALFRHGFRRFTEDVDILVSRSDLKRIHEELAGRGYLPPFAHSKSLRDTESGVRIEFLTTGDFPGDGKPKPVAFPDPADVNFEAEGIRYITLPKLVELKLASGMTSLGRLKDLADVLELIKVLRLPADFAQQLDPYVRDKFVELWREASRRYVLVRRVQSAERGFESLEEAIARLRAEDPVLDEMLAAGVSHEISGSGDEVSLRFVTTDADTATRFGMVEESEYWEDQAGG